jgi:hypothetical protein
MENEDQPKAEKEEIIQCAWCLVEFAQREFWKHADDCRRQNSILQIDLRRNQKYVKDGKMYTISEIEHVFRRSNHRSGQVNSIIVRLYCDEDQTSIRTAFRSDKRFRIDEHNYIYLSDQTQ